MLISVFCIPLFLFITFIIADKILPLPEPYQDKNFAKVVVDKDGKPLRYFADSNGELRYKVSVEDVPPLYIQALTGYEDRFFRYHPGINPIALLRSAWQYIRYGRIVSGGSTLTMQTARILEPHKKTIPGKIRQIFRAVQLEYHYTKDEILEMYLNLAPFGGNIQGVRTACYIYFDRDIRDINHAEAALLAVIPQAPSRLRPDRFPQAADNAKNKVAKRLATLGYWSRDEVDTVLKSQLFISDKKLPMKAPLLAERLVSQNPEESIIHTFIDQNLQDYIEELFILEKYSLAPGVSAAVIIVDNKNNNVIAYAGSIEYGNNSRFGYIDMVSSYRSPGSTLKPFIYAVALDKYLIHSKSLLVDAPRYYSTYRVANFYQNFSGPVAADDALQRSLNIPFVQLLEHITPEYFYTLMLSSGVKIPLLGNKPNLSIALGGAGIKLEDLAMLYTAFANSGYTQPLNFFQNSPESYQRQLFSEEAAYITYSTLRNQYRNDHIFITELTGKFNHLAWKTGTSYGFRDAFAIGVTKSYTIAVWTGRPDNLPVPGQFGSGTSSPILFKISDYIESINNQYELLEKPENVVETEICWPSGINSNTVEHKDCHKKLIALTINNATPSTLPETPDSTLQTYFYNWLENKHNKRVDLSCEKQFFHNKSAHIWPRLVEPWIESRYRRDHIIPEWDKSCKNGEFNKGSLIITSINNNSTIKSPSYDQKPQVALNAAGGIGLISWYLNGEHVGQTVSGSSINVSFDRNGQYQLLAADEAMQLDMIMFYVD